MRIIWKTATVDSCLRDRNWAMGGPACTALRPLLGDGLLLATGQAHTALRQQLGGALRSVSVCLDYDPPAGPCDLGAEMTRLAESVIFRTLFGVKPPEGVGRLVQRCVSLAPFRLLGLPLDWPWLRRLNRVLDALPMPLWLPADLSAKQRRDWAATFVVAGVETLAAKLTAELAGVELLPICWLPRKHAATGEWVILLLGDEHTYGAGVRKCVGEHLAREVLRQVRERYAVEVLPGSDLRATGLITRRLRRVRAVIKARGFEA